MTTEEIIEATIECAVKAYRKNSRGAKEAAKLDRHETVIINDIEFNYWREYGVYKTAEYIKERLPDCDITVNLDGNNSNIDLALSNEEERKLNGILYSLLKEFGWT